MTYELRIERQFDASPEAVFDAFADRTAAPRMTGLQFQRSWSTQASLR